MQPHARTPRRLLVLATLALIGAFSASTTAAPSGPAASTSAGPTANGKDWLKLKSGEWITGEFQRLRQDSVDFDSSHFGVLEIDFSDVVELRSSRQNMCRFDDRTEATGTLQIDAKTIRIGKQIYDRSKLNTIVSGEPSWKSYWSAGAHLGLSGSHGNTDQLNLSTSLNIARETTSSQFSINYQGNFADAEGVTVTNNNRVGGLYSRNLTRRFFLVIPSYEFYSDRFQNIDLRSTVAGGAGYKLLDRPALKWSALLAGGYRYSQYRSTVEGTEDTDETGTLVFGMASKRTFSGDTEFNLEYQFSMSLSETDDYDHRVYSMFTIDILGPFELAFTFSWDYVNNPVPDADENLPENSDYRYTVGIGVDL